MLVLNRAELDALAKLAPHCARVEIGTGEISGGGICVICVKPVWDPLLDIFIRKSSLVEALQEAALELRALEAAEQAAGDMHD